MAKYLKITLDLATEHNTTPLTIAYIRSCYNNLHLDREHMILRQEDKITNWKRYHEQLPKALKHRLDLATKFPNDAVRHKAAAQEIEKQLHDTEGNKRTEILQLLHKLSDEQFMKIVQSPGK